MDLYRHVPVWARTPDGVVLYQCLELLGQGFTVQSKDYFHAGSIPAGIAHSQQQLVELLQEQAPEERSPLHPTLQQAIAAFERDWS
ncbi:MAG: hypothetical protein R3F15_08865 [Lysobacterales bacterium]